MHTQDEGRSASPLTEGLGPADQGRAAFAQWCRENGHGELDDMLTPLDRSLRALMWPVWQGAVAAERERCAKLCEDISDEYQRREGMKYPELKSDAQTGASDCAAAIRRA